MKSVVLIAHNLRSTHNIGSLLRSCDGLGATKMYITGYSPYPLLPKNDDRLPHIAAKLDKQISKTSLGAEKTIPWQQSAEIEPILKQLKSDGYIIAGLEQASNSVPLSQFESPEKIALIVGREVEGVESEVLARCDVVLEIPMHGSKESFNVAVAGAIGLYELLKP